MATMSEAAKAARREYQRNWRKEHPNANKEYIARYWEKKAREIEGASAEDGC